MSTITRKYTLEGLDCANCAMKIEDAITKIDGIKNSRGYSLYAKIL